jgi:O-antigen/teichoic acid export membrane protein
MVLMVLDKIFQSENNSKYTLFLFARRIGLVGLARIITSLQGIILLPIMTKTFGASGYGVWAQILITIALVHPLLMLGFDSAILRFLPAKKKEEIGQGVITVLSIVLIIGLVASLIMFLSSDFLAIALLKEKSAAVVFKYASPLITISALNFIIRGSFRVFAQIKRYSGVLLFQTFLETGLIAFFVLSGYGLIGAVISLLIAGTITLLISLYLIISYAGLSSPDYSIIRPYLNYGLPLVPTLIFGFIISSSDRYVIGYFMGAEKVGIYSAAYGVGSIILMFSTYILYVLRPTVYGLFDKKKVDEVKMYLSYSWKYLLMFSIPSVFGLTILAKPLLTNLTTTSFISEGEFIVPIVAVSIVYYGVAMIFGVVLLSYKRPKVLASVYGCAAVLNLVLNIIFVPLWGIIGAAVTTFIAYYLLTIVIWYISYKRMKFNIQLGFLAKSIIASIFMSLIIWMVKPTGLITIFAIILISTIVYFSFLFLLKGFEEEELKIIRGVIRFRKRY